VLIVLSVFKLVFVPANDYLFYTQDAATNEQAPLLLFATRSLNIITWLVFVGVFAMELRSIWPSRSRWLDEQVRDEATGSSEPFWIIGLGICLATECIGSIYLCLEAKGALWHHFFRTMTVVSTHQTGYFSQSRIMIFPSLMFCFLRHFPDLVYLAFFYPRMRQAVFSVGKIASALRDTVGLMFLSVLVHFFVVRLLFENFDLVPQGGGLSLLEPTSNQPRTPAHTGSGLIKVRL